MLFVALVQFVPSILIWYPVALLDAVHVTFPAVLTVTPVGAFSVCFPTVIVIAASFVTFELLSVALTVYVYVPAGVFAAAVIFVPLIVK